MSDFYKYNTRKGLTIPEIKEIAWETIKTFSESRLPLWTRNRYGLIPDRIFTIGENGAKEIKCFKSGNLDTHIRIAGPYFDHVYGQGICIYVNGLYKITTFSFGDPFIKITEKEIIYFPNNFGKSALDDDKYWASSWLVGDTLKEFVNLIISTFQEPDTYIRSKDMQFWDGMTKAISKSMTEAIYTPESVRNKTFAQFGILTRPEFVVSTPFPLPPTPNFSIRPEVIWTDRGLEKILNGGECTMKIKKVVYSDPATIVFWEDGTKTVVKVAEGETFDKEVGLAMAIAEKYFGSYSAMKSYIKKKTMDVKEEKAKKKQKKEKKDG